LGFAAALGKHTVATTHSVMVEAKLQEKAVTMPGLIVI
jgi:nucleoside 2-deoxyribosyltransferase